VNDWMVFLCILFRNAAHKAVTVLFVKEVTFFICTALVNMCHIMHSIVIPVLCCSLPES